MVAEQGEGSIDLRPYARMNDAIGEQGARLDVLLARVGVLVDLIEASLGIP